jgi:hypothetical protein
MLKSAGDESQVLMMGIESDGCLKEARSEGKCFARDEDTLRDAMLIAAYLLQPSRLVTLGGRRMQVTSDGAGVTGLWG